MVRLVRLALGIGVVAAITLVATGATAGEQDGSSAPGTLSEQLTGYQEDPAALSTTGIGEFRAHISAPDEINYVLRYSGLEGTVTQAHIHFGGRAQSGGISVFLCSNLGNGPVGTPACPPGPATVAGTVRAADVIGPTAQGIEPGEFAELVAAVRAGVTYVNVHSTKYPGGEIRAQLG
jgi:hypothetical protein